MKNKPELEDAPGAEDREVDLDLEVSLDNEYRYDRDKKIMLPPHLAGAVDQLNDNWGVTGSRKDFVLVSVREKIDRVLRGVGQKETVEDSGSQISMVKLTIIIFIATVSSALLTAFLVGGVI